MLDWNTPSIEFYKAAGAVPMDEWTVFRLTDDALTDFAGPPGRPAGVGRVGPLARRVTTERVPRSAG